MKSRIVRLHVMLLTLARKAARQQLTTGAMEAGHNGPYLHSETPVRNTAHWLFNWCKCYVRSDDSVLYSAAQSAVDFLLSDQYRPLGVNWRHRNAAGRDACNGVIGGSWVIEALAMAAETLGRTDAFVAAEQAFLAHPVESATGLWHRIEPDGRILSIDRTLNHQLWFAAAGSRLARLGSSEVGERVRAFIDRLDGLVMLHPSGLIHHRIQLRWWDRLFEAERLGYRLHRRYVRMRRPGSLTTSGFKRDAGYHAYNLHALSTLRRNVPDHSFWSSAKLQKAIEYACSTTFRRANDISNPYSMPYNPVGFEIAWMLETFRPQNIVLPREWVERQIVALGGIEHYGKETVDPKTVAARLYEVAELEDLELFVP